MKSQNTATTAERQAEVATIIRAISQELGRLAGEASPTDIQTLRSALQRVSTVRTREEAARHSVTRACDAIARSTGQDDPYFDVLLWIDTACGAAIKELFCVAVMWRRIGRDLLDCGGISGSVIEHQCLRQCRRVTRLALDIMDRQLEVQREQGRLNSEASGMTQAESQETVALEQHQAQEDAEGKEG